MTAKVADNTLDDRSQRWKTFFDRGVELFRVSKHEEALEQFNKAASRKVDEKAIFDSRAAVLEKLGRNGEALKDAKRVIDLTPTSWQGYARSSRIFLKIGKLDASLKMVDLALERVKESDQKRRDEFQLLKRQILDAQQALRKRKSQRAYHFGNLPIEIASTIFHLVVGDDPCRAVILSHVCRNWRTTTLKTPALWQTLVLSQKNKRKAEAVLERSNGSVRHLDIRANFEFFQQSYFTRHACDTFWTELETLKLAITPRLGFCPAVAWKELRLKELTFSRSGADHLEQFWSGINQLAVDTVIHATFRGLNAPWSHLQNYRALKTIDLPFEQGYRVYSHRVLVSLLCNNLALEKVVFGAPVIIDDAIDPTNPNHTTPGESILNMASLHHLELIGMMLADSLELKFAFPSLKLLRLQRFFDLNRLLLVVFKPFAKTLTELHLESPTLDEASLISFLSETHSLVTFGLTGFIFTMHGVMDALAGRDRSMICPKLEHVHISRCDHLSSSSVVHLVKAHLSLPDQDERGAIAGEMDIAQPPREIVSDASADEGEGKDAITKPSPIQTLMLNECPLIDVDILPWLRKNVKRVSCHYISGRVKKTR
ncbi:hypothetical protein BD410DRAFT_787629 [Rickenella mellea]|uniref:Uncharacterized protein n=1 Tax=Rickenella mellea TaxID=50990 RepID=A0A4Y7Q843_9AGAM|nr:hypothetical protein BD410DRAFT_787629 [Rickenella mellea]